MRKIAVLSILLVLCAPAFGASRSQTKPYSYGAVVTTGPLPGGLTNDCSGDGPSFGGTCFVLGSNTKTVSVSVADDAALLVAADIEFTDDSVVPNQMGFFVHVCGQISDVVVPAAAKVMYVITESVLTPTQDCPVAATSGTVTATFSSS